MVPRSNSISALRQHSRTGSMRAHWSHERKPSSECDSFPRSSSKSFSSRTDSYTFFFCSTLLRCDLLAKKVPGRAPLQSAYHNPKLDVTELKQNRTSNSFRPKVAIKQIKKNKLDRRRRWQKSVGPKLVQGENRKERVANRELCR